MSGSNAGKVVAFAAIVLVLAAARGDAAVFATYDAAQHNANGFQFADFDDFFAVDTAGGVISIDIMTDLDSANGLFGGMGSDLVADFDAATTQLEVALTVDPLNVASNFRIVLVDNDSPTSGEEYQFYFDLTGLTPGQPAVLTQSLINPGPVFRQAAFEQEDGDMIQNYGLRQVQIQTEFGGTDRLKIDVESVKLVDPDDPLLIEFNSSTYAAQTQTFTFGSFMPANQPGALDVSGSTMIINADPAGTGGPDGGFGFNGLNVDFEASNYQIEIEAKLLAGNTAGQFNLLLGDNDGDDSGPGLGSDDYIFTVNTDDFNSSDFSTVTIPLGTGSESDVVTTFGFTNGGDGLQNFGLSQMQIQSSGEIEGDYDDDNFVSQADLDLVLLNWGDDFATDPIPAEWVNQIPTGLVGQEALDGVLLNWGAAGPGVLGVEILRFSIVERGVAPGIGVVPEPASIVLVLCGLLGFHRSLKS